jgi:uncharacterized membrane protein YkoI
MTTTTRIASLLAGIALSVFAAVSASADSLESLIESAEATFGGEAYAAGSIGGFAEVQLLSGDRLIEALYNAETGQLVDSETFGSGRIVQRVATALDVAVLSLVDAITAAQDAAGPGDVLEADLLISRRNSGRRFLVDLRTDDGIFDVIVDSQTGRIIRIIRD